jgi:monoamine oxidase
MGATIKAHVFYDRPFWREDGMSGEVVATSGPLSVVFDNTSRDGDVASLVCFSVGGAARDLGRFSEAERRRVIVRSLEKWFGPRAREPVAYVDKDWVADEWTRGCPTGFLPPGVLAAYGSGLRDPEGPFHWAGTETAREWAGYMEGALEAGERAAEEVIARL